MSERRLALLIANQTYAAPSDFSALKSPHLDVDSLREVLEDPELGGFDEVRVIKDETREETMIAIDTMLEKKAKSDVLMIYFSGHGKTDDNNKLYLATANSRTAHLRATAIDGGQLADTLGSSHAERTVLVLDCCHAGAYAAGFKSDDALQNTTDQYARAGGSYVLMACGEYELARDGRKGEMSHLTHHLVEGLKGAADLNQDGEITVRELTDYLDEVLARGGGQKFNQAGSNQRGDILLSRSAALPSADVRAKLREKLHGWQKSERVSDKVVSEVYAYFEATSDLDGKPDDPRWDLLNEVAQDKIQSVRFLERWFALRPVAETSAPEPAQPVPGFAEAAAEIAIEPEPAPVITPDPEPEPMLEDTAPADTSETYDEPGFLSGVLDDLADFIFVDAFDWIIAFGALCLTAGAAALVSHLTLLWFQGLILSVAFLPFHTAVVIMFLAICVIMTTIWCLFNEDVYDLGDAFVAVPLRLLLVVPMAYGLHAMFGTEVYFELLHAWDTLMAGPVSSGK